MPIPLHMELLPSMLGPLPAKASPWPACNYGKVVEEEISLEISRILQFRTPKWGKQTQRYLTWPVQFCLKVRAGVHPSQRLLGPP